MKFIDDIIHGKSEDIFIRSARNREFKEKYGNIHIATWLPFYFTYINVKDVIKKNPEITKKEIIIGCAINLGLELILDATRIGAIYGLYKFNEYLYK